ncbi:hypothetical protein ZOSMA_486G00020 [Zostera marina]|uniref:Uncharacterized protein n=1 Tax=Zostera marina TaxID=29655 RepID=A0A0K9NZP7_ZOSMR|nr:hypothetical protein ZOSMA_486G00020 [Zostera marina]
MQTLISSAATPSLLLSSAYGSGSRLRLLHNSTSNLRIRISRPSNRTIRCDAQEVSTIFELAPVASAVYGTLLFGGGLSAYFRSGSKGSALGGASGGALMATYYLMQTPETKVAGDAIGFGCALLFSAVFGIRLVATKKPFPASLLLGISTGAMFVFVSAYLQDKI